MKKIWLAAALASCSMLCACGRQSPFPAPAEAPPAATAQQLEEIIRPDVSAAFSSRDLAGSYDAQSAVKINLTGNSAACDDSAVRIGGDDQGLPPDMGGRPGNKPRG